MTGIEDNRTIQPGSVVTVQIITMLIAVVSMLIDGIMTGIFLGDESQAAYGLTNPVSMIMVALGGLLAAGSQVIGGRLAGRKDDEGLDRILVTSVAAGITGGLIVSVIISVFIHPICLALGAAQEPLAGLTEQYLKGIVFCLPALVIAQILPGFLQLKNCRRQLVTAAVTQIVTDVVLDYLNVRFFHMGLFGMAMATVISCYIYVILLIIPAMTTGGYKIRAGSFSVRTLGRVSIYGLLYLLYKVSFAVTVIFINRSLAAHGSADHLTASSIILSVELIIGAFPSGFGSSTSMLTGIARAQGGDAAAHDMFRRIVIMSVIVNVIQIILIMVFAGPLVMIFSPRSADAMNLSVFGLRLYVLAVLPNTINYIARNFEQSMEHTRNSYIICIANHLALPLLAGLVLIQVLPARYIWLCFVIGQTLCMPVTYIIMRRSRTALEQQTEG